VLFHATSPVPHCSIARNLWHVAHLKRLFKLRWRRTKLTTGEVVNIGKLQLVCQQLS
jgi:hypothetical protein